MTYYIAESSREPCYICMSEDLHYRWFRRISDIDVSLLTDKSRIYAKVEDWLNAITSNGMRFICKFDEDNNPEMFI